MENIGSGTDTAQHHSNYNCDIGLVSAHHHRHQQQVINHQLSLQDREKNFSVTHLLDLPGHLYHDTQSGDVSRVNNGGLEAHQRINQSIKAHEGRKCFPDFNFINKIMNYHVWLLTCTIKCESVWRSNYLKNKQKVDKIEIIWFLKRENR